MAHGMTSRDRRDFSEDTLPRLRSAAEDLRLLLGRGYGMNESLQLVGNHFRLTKRQRQLLYRGIVAPRKARVRQRKVIAVRHLAGRRLWVDGYNALIISETCLAGGIVLLSDDGVLRDIQGVFGAFRVSEHTDAALDHLTAVLSDHKPAATTVILDERMRFARHVEKQWRRRFARSGLERAEVRQVERVDRMLQDAPADTVIATSDRETIDAAEQVCDLPRAVAERCDSRLLEL